ncbi:MAG: hypothetical protein AB4080_15230 [Trichodesmium sp.]
MSNINTSGQMRPHSENNYSPSVPISVYREATGELQSTQIKLESLKVHNEQLIQQNQKLRREIENVINSAIQLQEALNAVQSITQVGQPQIPSFPNSDKKIDNSVSSNYSNYLSSDFEVDAPDMSPPSPPSPSLPFTQPKSTDPDFPEHLFTEEPDQSRYGRFPKSNQVSELNGLWLIVAICLIVIAAFGAGYWVIRPILNNRR